MSSRLLVSLGCLLASVSAVDAAPRHHHQTRHANLARMNLTPRRDLVRSQDVRAFTSDTTPTSFRYPLPAPGTSAVVGYKPYVDPHPIPGYEVNQATALGFSQPTTTVGAAVGVKF